MSAPLVSVVVNCYNSAAYLREALESVRAQTFADWELVFWDNRSTDGSAEIFRSFGDPRFRYFLAEAHAGLGEARNLAVAEAAGKWLAFLDCDDTWMPGKLAAQLRHVSGEVGLVYCPVRLEVGAAGENSALAGYYRRQVVRPHAARRIYEDLLEGNFIIVSTILLRRDLFYAAGGIDGRLVQNEDYDLLLKVSRLTQAVCLEEPCASYRIHGSNASHTRVELNFRENVGIFAALPQDDAVRRAREINASRHAVYKMSRGEVLPGLRMLFAEGSPAWALKRACARLMEKL